MKLMKKELWDGTIGVAYDSVEAQVIGRVYWQVNRQVFQVVSWQVFGQVYWQVEGKL